MRNRGSTRSLARFSIAIGWSSGVFALSLPLTAYAQSSMPIETIKETHGLQFPSQYYTQLRVTVPQIELPDDDRDSQKFGKALLRALGLQKDVKSITISLVVTAKGIALPEYPLVTYSFDKGKNFSSVEVVGDLSTPLWHLGSSDPVTVQLKYRYSNSADLNSQGVTSAITGIVPSSTLLAPPVVDLIKGVTTLADSVYKAANSEDRSDSQQEQLRADPTGPTKITFNILSPEGSQTSKVVVELYSTPTLSRAAAPISIMSDAAFVHDALEPIGDIAIKSAGSNRVASSDVQALPEFAALGHDKSVAAVSSFCGKANPLLRDQYDLTTMDRTLVIDRALEGAGFTQSDNGWYFACFDDTDRTMLFKSLSIQNVQKTPPVVVKPATSWPSALKDAFGCWMIPSGGGWCGNHVQSPRQVVEESMGDTVSIGAIDLTTIDLSTLPTNRVWSRSALLDQLSGKVARFACYSQGLVVATADGKSYSVIVSLDGGKITSLAIQHTDPDAIECRGG